MELPGQRSKAYGRGALLASSQHGEVVRGWGMLELGPQGESFSSRTVRGLYLFMDNKKDYFNGDCHLSPAKDGF